MAQNCDGCAETDTWYWAENDTGYVVCHYCHTALGVVEEGGAVCAVASEVIQMFGTRRIAGMLCAAEAEKA